MGLGVSIVPILVHEPIMITIFFTRCLKNEYATDTSEIRELEKGKKKRGKNERDNGQEIEGREKWKKQTQLLEIYCLFQNRWY